MSESKSNCLDYGRAEIKSLQLNNFNTGRVNSEKKIVTLQLFSPVSFQMCSQTTRQNRLKFRNCHCSHICKENFFKSFEDYGRRIAALNDKNTNRPMKKGATKKKNF